MGSRSKKKNTEGKNIKREAPFEFAKGFLEGTVLKKRHLVFKIITAICLIVLIAVFFLPVINVELKMDLDVLESKGIAVSLFKNVVKLSFLDAIIIQSSAYDSGLDYIMQHIEIGRLDMSKGGTGYKLAYMLTNQLYTEQEVEDLNNLFFAFFIMGLLYAIFTVAAIAVYFLSFNRELLNVCEMLLVSIVSVILGGVIGIIAATEESLLMGVGAWLLLLLIAHSIYSIVYLARRKTFLKKSKDIFENEKV